MYFFLICNSFRYIYIYINNEFIFFFLILAYEKYKKTVQDFKFFKIIRQWIEKDNECHQILIYLGSVWFYI